MNVDVELGFHVLTAKSANFVRDHLLHSSVRIDPHSSPPFHPNPWNPMEVRKRYVGTYLAEARRESFATGMKTPMKTMIARPALLCLSLLFFACSGSENGSSEAPSPSPEKADLASQDGKADSTAVARMCKEMGAPPDCDICERKGWYSDGECDTFCSSPDPDCQQPQELNCNDLDIEFEICLERWGYVSKHCIEGLAYDDLLDQAKACCPDSSLNMCEHLLESDCIGLNNVFGDCVAEEDPSGESCVENLANANLIGQAKSCCQNESLDLEMCDFYELFRQY